MSSEVAAQPSTDLHTIVKAMLLCLFLVTDQILTLRKRFNAKLCAKIERKKRHGSQPNALLAADRATVLAMKVWQGRQWYAYLIKATICVPVSVQHLTNV